MHPRERAASSGISTSTNRVWPARPIRPRLRGDFVNDMARTYQTWRIRLGGRFYDAYVRPAKLGAKNYLFFGNAGAGSNNALFYTLMANCKTQGLNPEDYLIEVINRLPHNATPEQAAELTPARVAADRRAKAQEVA